MQVSVSTVFHASSKLICTLGTFALIAGCTPSSNLGGIVLRSQVNAITVANRRTPTPSPSSTPDPVATASPTASPVAVPGRTPSPTPNPTATPVPTPGVPSSVSAAAGTANIALSWAAPAGTETFKYTVLRSLSSGSGFTSLASNVSATSYTDLTALNGTTYYYRVQTNGLGGASNDSAEVLGRPLGTFSTTSVAVNDTAGADALQVTWPALTGATDYTVKVGTSSGNYTTTTISHATSPTTISSLTPGTPYYVKVVASHAIGLGLSVNSSNELSAVPMAAFTISSVTEPSDSQGLVTWGASSGSTSFTLKYGTVSGTYGTTVSASATSPMPVSALTNGTPYYFKVIAANSYGSLSSSNEGTLTPVQINLTANPYYYADPFPGTVNTITASQASNTILYDDTGTTSASVPSVPASSSIGSPYTVVGMNGMSTEFWLKIAPTSAAVAGGFVLAQGPGFQVIYNMGYSSYRLYLNIQGSSQVGPAGKLGTYYSGSVQLPPDLLFHHYVVTYDTHTMRVFQDGEALPVNHGGMIGPKLFAQVTDDHIGPDGSNQIYVVNHPSSLGYKSNASNIISQNLIKIFGIRVSALALDAQQVKSNFENYNRYTKIIYASATGNAALIGSSVGAPTTLAHAITLLTPGSKLILAGGTYAASDFQFSGLAGTAAAPIVITGADGNTQINITNGGGTSSASILNSSYVFLKHLNFIDSVSVPALIVNAGIGVKLEGLRVSGLSDGLKLQASSSITVDNSVFQAAARQIYFVNTSGTLLRQNTVYQGQTGLYFDTNSLGASLINNIFSGQTSYCVNFQSTSQLSVFADGNDYAPASGGAVMLIQSQTFTAAQVSSHAFSAGVSLSANQDKTNFRVINSGTAVTAGLYGLRNGCVGCGNGINTVSGYLAEKKSTALAPVFAAPTQGDFRMTAASGNPAGIGVPYLIQGGFWTSLYDIQGSMRSLVETQDQGNLFDPGAYITPTFLYEKTYNLSANRKTSAGVYTAAGKLIRTLWSGKLDTAGTHRLAWNGIDDEGKVAAAGSYNFTVMDYDVSYVAEGLVGNSSLNPLSPTQTFHTAAGINSMVMAGNQLFWVGVYSEGGANIASMDLSNFNVASDYFGNKGNPLTNGGAPYALTTQLASDGTTLYGINSHWIQSYNVQTHAPIWQIPQDWTLQWGSTTPFTAIQVPEAVLPSTGYDPRADGNSGNDVNSLSGIAVQPNGNYLFAARKLDNLVYVFNKSTGASVKTISVPAPTFMSCDSTGDLWVISNNSLLHYTNLTTTPTLASTSTGFTQLLSVAGSPLDSSALVLDGGTSSQVKKIAADGTVAWTYGQSGGYASNGPLVTHDKFKFSNDERGMGFIAYQPDGSFWIPDTATHRYMKFSMSGNTPTYVKEFNFHPMSYRVAVNLTDPTLVYSDFIEYKIDYTKPLSQGWTITNYWGGNLSDANQSNLMSYVGNVATYPNGKTYTLSTCLFNECNPVNSATVLYELNPASGLIQTGSINMNAKFGGSYTTTVTSLQPDLSVMATNNIGTGYQINSTPLTGSATPSYANSQALATMTASTDPVFQDTLTAASYDWMRGRNNLLIAEMTGSMPGFHMKARKVGDTDWLWQANSDWGGEDGHGHAESQCQYCMSNIITNDGQIITYNRGEFYLNATEANLIHHFYDNGLFIGEFGVADVGAGSPYYSTTGAPKAFQSIGNLMTGGLVKDSAGNFYLYTNGESASGMGRWKIALSLNLQNISTDP